MKITKAAMILIITILACLSVTAYTYIGDSEIGIGSKIEGNTEYKLYTTAYDSKTNIGFFANGTTPAGLAIALNQNNGVAAIMSRDIDNTMKEMQFYANRYRFYNSTSDQIMKITPSGWVGIGTDNPLAPLHVRKTSGDGFWLGEQRGTYDGAMGGGFNSNNNVFSLFFRDPTDDVPYNNLWMHAAKYIMHINGTQAMRIMPSGNVKIGTGIAAAKLEVDGDVYIDNTGLINITTMPINFSLITGGADNNYYEYPMLSFDSDDKSPIIPNRFALFEGTFAITDKESDQASVALISTVNQANGELLTGVAEMTYNSTSDIMTYSGAGKYVFDNPISIYPDENDKSVYIDTDATTGDSFYKSGGLVIQGNSLTTGNAATFYSDSASGSFTGAGIDGLVGISVDNTGATGNALGVKQDGTGDGIFLDQNGNGTALRIDSEEVGGTTFSIENSDSTNTMMILARNGNAEVVRLNRDQTSSDGTNLFYRDLDSTNTAGALMNVVNDNSGDDQNALKIQQDGTGSGIFIDQNGNGNSLYIDSESTTKPAIVIDQKVADVQNSIAILHDGTNKFRVRREDSVNENVTLILGNYHIWIDSTGDLRIKNSVPTSDTDGSVVGAQT
ncbi:MAG: hypothetical protein U9R08_03575 [Nanoarchaeota archaeon]|nr:hypothetical protein [Nanoarchaeota archaeon]